MLPKLPFGRYPAVHTTSLDEATEIFSRLTTPARLQPNERFRVGTGYRALQLTVSQFEMEAALAALSGAASTTPLRFEPNLPFGSGVGAWLHRLVHFVAGEVEHDVNPFASPVVGARLADTVIYGLLQGHPHNHSARLASGLSAEPRYVREAAEYLEAHAADPVRMAELARLTGVGVRALQLGFQKSRGCSPMEFLKEQRLHLARKKLVGGARLTVTVPSADFSPVRFGIDVAAGSDSAKLRVVWKITSSPNGGASIQAIAATLTSQ